jgi:hypothetical protein
MGRRPLCPHGAEHRAAQRSQCVVDDVSPIRGRVFSLICLLRSATQSEPFHKRCSETHTRLYRFPWHDIDAPAERYYCQHHQDHLLHIALLVASDSPLHPFLSPISVAHRADRPLRGVERGLSTSAGDAARICGVHLDGEKKPISVSLLCSSIAQNDRIDNLATLHATLSAVVRQILAPLGDHESAATRTTTRAMDSCPASSHSLNRLLLCIRQRRSHRCLPQRSTGLPHAIHNEM